jgi:hypothetical protein
VLALALFVADSQASFTCSCNTKSQYLNSITLSYSGVPYQYYWAAIFESSANPSGAPCHDYISYWSSNGQRTSYGNHEFDFSGSGSFYTCALYGSETPIYQQPGYDYSSCQNPNITYTTCYSYPDYSPQPLGGGAIFGIVVAVLFAIAFLITLILCCVRRAKEREEEKARMKDFSNPTDTSVVDLSDQGQANQMPAMMTTMPGVQGGAPMGMMQNGTSFSPYMTMPPAVYYMPNQNGTMTPMYMATNPVMMAGNGQQYYVQTNPMAQVQTNPMQQ